MENFKELKQRILTDDKVANAIEYLLSKVILDKRLPQLRFIYKKHKIVLGRNGLYSIYKPNGQKLANKIHYQEVAKYVIDNIKNPYKSDYILRLESELFRHKEKIEFFSYYNNKVNIDVLDSKIQAMYDHYYQCKNSLLSLLRYYIQ